LFKGDRKIIRVRDLLAYRFSLNDLAISSLVQYPRNPIT